LKRSVKSFIRAAVEGYYALAPDGLSLIGGYNGNCDNVKVIHESLDPDKLFVYTFNGTRFLIGHELSNGKIGVTVFYYSGGVVNNPAVVMDADHGIVKIASIRISSVGAICFKRLHMATFEPEWSLPNGYSV